MTENRPGAEVNLFLARPGSLRGRLEDGNGNPLADRSVFIEASPTLGLPLELSTDSGGAFLAARLPPGNYVVRVSGSHPPTSVLEQFTEQDATRVETDVEASFWPGGVLTRSAAIPIPVVPGATTDIGTLRPRTTSYHRVRLSLSGADCEQGLRLSVALRLPANASPSEQAVAPAYNAKIPCREELLMKGLAEGSYWLAMINETKPPRWALAAVDVGPENNAVNVAFHPAVQVPVRFVAAAGASIEILPNPPVLLLPESQGMQLPASPISASGRASLNVLWPSQRVSVRLLAPYYVSEIRYGGRPVVNDVISPVAGAELEIVIDNRSAIVTGSVTNGAADLGVFLLKYPGTQPLDTLRPFPSGTTGPGGRFSLRGVPPGEYRVVVLARDEMELLLDPLAIVDLAARGETVTVMRGETKNITLRAK